MGRELKEFVPFNAIIILAKIHPQSYTELGAGTPNHLEESAGSLTNPPQPNLGGGFLAKYQGTPSSTWTPVYRKFLFIRLSI